MATSLFLCTSTSTTEGLALPSSPLPPKKTTTIVVTGATGRVGSRLVRRLLEDNGRDGGGVRTVALVRNATKARCMFGREGDVECDDPLTILEADFTDDASLEAAFSTLQHVPDETDGDGDRSLRLFLACANGPDQETLELNVARAASAAAGDSCFCVKLSTAQPLVEGSIGAGGVHRKIEDELQKIYPDRCTAMLRPNLFYQMLDPDDGGAFLGIKLDSDSDDGPNSCRHPFADSPISIIDADDVAACAASILTNDDPQTHHGGNAYELTGPEPVVLSNHLAELLTSLRTSPVSILPCTVLEHLLSSGLPPPAAQQIAPFLQTIASCSTVTNTVHSLTGRHPTTLTQSVYHSPTPFLPPTFRQLLATARSPSFRTAAKTVTSPLPPLTTLEPDELLLRVRAAGVNGGADTFGVTRADANARDFPLGNEGTGTVLLRGTNATAFQPGDTVVFLGQGAYGQYVRVKEARACGVKDGRTATPSELTALRISGLTALVALERTRPVRAGDVVVVTACCGGTGHFAVQVAKNAGATVVGTVGSGAKVRHAVGLGVDRVVDLSREKLGDVLQAEFPQGVDVAYEGVGGKLLKDVCDNLADGGSVLVVGSISQYPHNQEEEREAHGVEGLGDVMELFREGKTVELGRGRSVVGNVWGDVFGSGDMAKYRDRVFDLHARGELKVLLDPEQVFVGVDSVCDAVDHMLGRGSVGKVCVKM